MDTSFVRESAETSDVVVEGDVDFDSLGDEIFNILELLELVLAADVVAVGDYHAGHESAEGGDAVTFADSEDGGVNMGGSGWDVH